MRHYTKALLCLTAMSFGTQAEAARRITLTLEATGEGLSVIGYGAPGPIYQPIRSAALTVALDNFGSDPNYFTYYGSGPLISVYFNGTTLSLNTGGSIPSYYAFLGTASVCGVTGSAPTTSSPDPACSSLTYSTSYPGGYGSRFTGQITRYTIVEGDATGGAGLSIATFVPEPSTWALMLAGFGLTGYALRCRRVAVAIA